MENINITGNQDFFKYHDLERQYRKTGTHVDTAENMELFEKLDAEGNKIFFHYLKWLGLAKDRNLIILSPTHHYYYEAEDLKGIKTLVNLKQLNDIKQLMDFFYNIFQILSFESYFIGCFYDKNDQNGFASESPKPEPEIKGWAYGTSNINSFRLPFFNRIYNKIDFRARKYLTNGTVTVLLEEAFLKVLDMSRLNGLTYFCAQKTQSMSVYEQFS